MGLHLENEVAVVTTPTIVSNNPVQVIKDKNIQKRNSSYKYKTLRGIRKTWNFCNTVESLPAVGLRVRNQLADERPRFAVYLVPGLR